MNSADSAARPVLLRNGSVYSTADPFASAMIVEGSQVVWVGSEQAADSLADNRMEVIDLDGDLVTPAFVDSAVTLGASEQASGLAGRGIAVAVDVARVSRSAADPAQSNSTDASPVGTRAVETGDRELTILRWPTAGLTDIGGGTASTDAVPSTGSVGWRAVTRDASEADLEGFLTACITDSLRPALVVDRPGTGPVLRTALEAAREKLGVHAVNASGLRLEFAKELTAAEIQAVLDALDGFGFSVCMDPATTPLAAEYYRRGIPVALGGGHTPLDPWDAVKSLVNHPEPEQRISARAAFTAATRGAWRALGQGGPLAGQLVPGAPATYSRWQVEALMVQAASGTGASWSTDPRARTPLLPALEDESLPVCMSTVAEGRELYAR